MDNGFHSRAVAAVAGRSKIRERNVASILPGSKSMHHNLTRLNTFNISELGEPSQLTILYLPPGADRRKASKISRPKQSGILPSPFMDSETSSRMVRVSKRRNMMSFRLPCASLATQMISNRFCLRSVNSSKGQLVYFTASNIMPWTSLALIRSKKVHERSGSEN